VTLPSSAIIGCSSMRSPTLVKIEGNANKIWVLALTSIASFVIALDALVVTTALNTIRLDLHSSLEALEWTVNAYNLSFAGLLLTGAALGDRFGRQQMSAVGLALFAATSVACALAGNITWLILARAVQGAGAALVMPLAMALPSSTFAPEERARALGIFSGVTELALIVGPVVGGVIAERIAWQWIFWINVPIVLITLPMILRRVPEGFGPDSALDAPGLVLATGGAFGLVWALMRGNEAGWLSLEVVAGLAVGLLLAIAFVAREQLASAPMMPMRFLLARAFSAGIAASFFLHASVYGTLFLLPQFLQIALDDAALGAGLHLLPWTATLFVTAPLAGSVINRVGERPLVVIGLLLHACGLAWIGLVAASNAPYMNLVVPLVLTGVGASIAMPATQNAVISAVAPSEIGKASGTFNMVRFLGGAFGIAILGAVFSSLGNVCTSEAFSNGFMSAMLVAAALSVLGALAGLWQPGRKQSSVTVRAKA